MDWYYSTDGETQIGPISEEALIKTIKNKRVSKTSLIWNEELNDWKKIKDLPHFKEHFQAVPPPLPKQRNDVEFEATTDFVKGEDNFQKNSFPKEDIISSDVEEKEGWLPKDLICSLCGAGVELEEQERKEGKFVCPTCGGVIDKGLIEGENALPERLRKYKVVNKSEKKEGVEKNLPTRWLSFYVNGWLPVGIILNLFGFSGDLNEEEILFQTVWILFLALTFLGLKNRKKWGWYLNWLIIFWLPIGGSLMFINHPYFIGYLIGGLLIFAVPNAIYFKKRNDLFFHIEQNQEVKNNNSDILFFYRSDKIKPPKNSKIIDLLTESTYTLSTTLDDFEKKVEHYSKELPVYLCYELNIRGHTISAELVKRLNKFSFDEFQTSFSELIKQYKL